MNDRDKFAMFAMHAIMMATMAAKKNEAMGTMEWSCTSPDSIADVAYRTADAMIERRGARQNCRTQGSRCRE